MILFRFTLSHEVLGEQVISEPQGWVDTVLKLERHEDFHSLVEYFEGEFTFYGNNGRQNGGAEFIRQVERQYGFDTTLGILVEISTDGYTYENVFTGQLDLSQIEELPDNKIQVPIIRDDFWSKFINRLDTQVNLQSDLSLDGDEIDQFDSINLKLPSQKVQKTTLYEGEFFLQSDFAEFPLDEIDASGAFDGPYFAYSQVALDLIQDEIKDSFTLPFSMRLTSADIFNLIYMVDEGGEIAINVNANLSPIFEGFINETSVESDPSTLTQIGLTVSVVAKINSGSEVVLDNISVVDNGPFPEPVIGIPASIGSNLGPIQLNGSYTVTVNPGDEIRVYLVYVLTFSIDVGADTGNRDWTLRSLSVQDFESDVTFTIQSIFQDSTAESFLLHDAAGHILDRITGQNQSFYSELLGSTQTVYRQYDADGCDWEYALSRGLQIRRYSLIEKPFSQSFKQWWEGANPILNLGLGYETLEGEQVIRVEDKRHFYDDSEVSVNISNVRDIVRKYDPNRLFKTVRIGYKKWQSEDVSGIDDPQTKRTYATRLQKSGKDLIIESDFIAGSLAIETTRRSTREKSADYKFDNDTFIIAIRPDPISISPETSPDVTDYEPELDENFTSVQNLLNADTRYNIRLTPVRNLIRWIDWLSGGLQAYTDSVFKFTSGEGNFDVITDMANVSDGCENYYPSLSEKQNLPVSVNPFHLASEFEINCPLEWDDYVLIRDNRKKAIGISQTDSNHVKFFIKDLEYSPVKGEVKITAWPVEFMNVEVIETTTNMLVCAPVDPCEDSFITEIGDEFVTEDEDCLILE